MRRKEKNGAVERKKSSHSSTASAERCVLCFVPVVEMKKKAKNKIKPMKINFSICDDVAHTTLNKL